MIEVFKILDHRYDSRCCTRINM